MPNTNSNQLEVDDIYAKGEERSRRRSSTKEPISYTNRAIERFAEAIKAMNDAVLLPSKLKDIEVSEAEAGDVLDFDIAPKTDLYQYYSMLNNVKDDLFNGLSISDEMIINGNGNQNNNNFSSNNSTNGRDRQQWDRQQSDEAFNSLTSLSSLSVSLDGEPVSFEDRATQLMSVFMQHLQSLYGILHHFSKAAEYITKRYQQEIDGDSTDK